MSGKRILAGLVRVLLLLFSAVFLASLVVAGLFVLLVTIVWSLLRGRKPAVFHVYTQFRNASQRFRHGGFAAPSPQPSAADIVDVDAHEVDVTRSLK
jgi:hypothetical protein